MGSLHFFLFLMYLHRSFQNPNECDHELEIVSFGPW